MPEYVGDVSVRYISRPKDVPNELEVNHSLLAQCEIDSLRSEILNLQDQRDLAMKLIKKLEAERDELRSIVEQRLVAGATIHQNANDIMRRNERLESERDELVGVIKSLRKNAKEDADRIEKLAQAMSYGPNGKTLLSKFLNAVKERNELRESSSLLIKRLVLQIEYPAYTVDEVVDKMFLMESAKKFINEVQ